MKIFERVMLIRRQTKNIIQIFCEISLHSQVIFKSMKVADDISRGTLECEWVNVIHLGNKGIGLFHFFANGYFLLLENLLNVIVTFVHFVHEQYSGLSYS